MLVQFGFDVRRTNVGSVFDGNFNRFKAPFLERLEQGGAVIREGRGEKECIDTKSHNGTILIFLSLRYEARVSIVFGWGKCGLCASEIFLIGFRQGLDLRRLKTTFQRMNSMKDRSPSTCQRLAGFSGAHRVGQEPKGGK